jgi:hypothetical protein
MRTQLLDFALGVVEGDPRPVDPGAQRCADRGQLDPAGRPDEQLRLQPGLQPLQAAGQRRLADPQPLGRAGDVERLADGEEIVELPVEQRHALDLWLCAF